MTSGRKRWHAVKVIALTLQRRFKAFHKLAAGIAGIETAHMIREGQIAADHATLFHAFTGLAT